MRCDVPRRLLDDVAFAQDLQGCQTRGAGGRVARVGQAVGELTLVGKQYVGDPVADHDAAQGDVAVGDRLGEGHQVGLEVVSLATEPVAGASETADHLVHDQAVCRAHRRCGGFQASRFPGE